MTGVEKLRLVIDGDSSGAKRALQSLGGDMRGLDRTTSGTTSSMRALAATFCAHVGRSVPGLYAVITIADCRRVSHSIAGSTHSRTAGSSAATSASS